MMVLEDDAPVMRCCGPADCGRRQVPGLSTDPQRMCLGSACMAWRWISTGNIDNPTREPNKGFARKIVGGYCGLAGEP